MFLCCLEYWGGQREFVSLKSRGGLSDLETVVLVALDEHEGNTELKVLVFLSVCVHLLYVDHSIGLLTPHLGDIQFTDQLNNNSKIWTALMKANTHISSLRPPWHLDNPRSR